MLKDTCQHMTWPQTYSLLGNKREALEYLQTAYQRHEAALVSIRNNPAFEGLHSDPAFRSLVVQIGLPPLP